MDDEEESNYFLTVSDSELGEYFRKENDTSEGEQSPWCFLPDLIMEKIFSYLSMKERYWASMVCRSWYEAFYLPRIWSEFIFEETTLTRRRYNYYTGWQFFLDHMRTQQCLATVGRNFRILEFSPKCNFHNMYDFMNTLSYYSEMQGKDKWTVPGVGSKVHTLRYTFPCNMDYGHPAPEQSRLYGTGGKLLAAVKRLMRCLTSLETLILVDLMLETGEALTLLDEVCYERTTGLRKLHLINPTKSPCQILHVGVFLNLQILVITPQNLGEDVVYLLGQTELRHLHILQNRYSPVDVKSVSAKAWAELSRSSPLLRVHLTLESIRERSLVWQEKAPVASILYNSPKCKLDPEILERAMEWYRDHLKLFGFLGLPKYSQPKSFNSRADPLLVMLTKECSKIETLVIRERVSTCTLLLIVEVNKNLKWLYVRRNAVILKFDWPRNPDWSEEYFNWLKKTSRSYDLMERAISSKLKFRWNLLSDKDFIQLCPAMF